MGRRLDRPACGRGGRDPPASYLRVKAPSVMPASGCTHLERERTNRKLNRFFLFPFVSNRFRATVPPPPDPPLFPPQPPLRLSISSTRPGFHA
jgi:hypothetical protein